MERNQLIMKLAKKKAERLLQEEKVLRLELEHLDNSKSSEEDMDLKYMVIQDIKYEIEGTDVYDIESGETNLIVLEGSVEFAGELGTILAGAMESSKNGGAIQQLTAEDLPSWQNNTDPGITFKLKPDKLGKQQIGKVIKVSIQILNAKSKIFNDSFSGPVTVESQQSSDLAVSADGSSWSSSVTVNINRGRGVAQVKSSGQGKFDIIVNADDAESKLIGFEYFQSKTQKRASQNKLVGLAAKIGNDKLSKLIQEKILLKSQIIQGVGNVNDVLQQLETGELAMDGDPVIIDNGDGTVSVKMIVKPR